MGKADRLDIQPWRDALQLHDEPRLVLKVKRGGKRRTEAHTKVRAAFYAEDEEVEAYVQQVRKMRLALVTEVDGDGRVITEEIEDEETLLEAARMLQARDAATVCGVVAAEDEDPSEEAAVLRKEIINEFDGRVFRDRVWPNPPERGTHGKAKLRLKPGAAPVLGRPIHLKGERLEAMKELEKEFLADGKLEPGRGPWR